MIRLNSPLLLSGLLLAAPAAAQSPGATSPASASSPTTPASSTPAATPTAAAPSSAPTATPATPAPAPATPTPAATAPQPTTTAPALKTEKLPFTARGPSAPLGLSRAPKGQEFHFDFHGYLRAPLRVGRKSRDTVGPDQDATVYHDPLLIDDQNLNWSSTRAQEKGLAELYFSYGNANATGTIEVEAADFGLYQPLFVTRASPTDAQIGIAQGWVVIHPDLGVQNLHLDWSIGAFREKFGQAGRYDAGPYDTYLFGRIRQAGETLKAEYAVGNGDLVLKAEHGIGGHGEQSWPEIPLGSQRPSAAPNQAASFIHHAHLGLSYRGIVDLNLHWLNAFEQDGTTATSPFDGSLTVMGPEARVEGGTLGSLYIGFSYLKATRAREIGPVIEVLHSLGGGGGIGTDLTSNYFDVLPRNYLPGGMPQPPTTVYSEGTGTISSLEFNYEYSFGRLWREIKNPGIGFHGDGPEVRLGLFGMYNKVTSDIAATNGVSKLKFGADLLANPISWFGLGLRFDQVHPNMNDPDSANANTQFSVISPRLVLRSGWNSHDEISLIFSHYTYGSAIDQGPPNWAAPGFNGPAFNYGGGGGYGNTTNNAPFNTTTGLNGASATPPDRNVIALKATMWW